MYVSSHVWRTFSCTCILCKWWCTLLYSTVYTVYLYSKPRMSGSKQQHSSVIAGPAKKPQKLAVQRKDKETRGRGKGRTKEVHSAGNGKGIFFIWGGVVSFCGTGPKHTTVREGCSSHSGATQCSRVIYEEKKRLATHFTLTPGYTLWEPRMDHYAIHLPFLSAPTPPSLGSQQFYVGAFNAYIM